MALIEENFDLIIAILAFITLVVILIVVFNRRQFLNWFFVLFFASIGELIYFSSNFFPIARELADAIFLIGFFAIYAISLDDYQKYVSKKELHLKLFIRKFVFYNIIIFLLFSPIIYFLTIGLTNPIVTFMLSYTLILVLISNILYLNILKNDFTITKLFFFFSIFSILTSNIATEGSFFGIAIFWDLSYVLNIVAYGFFIACSLTVYSEDKLVKVTTDLDEKESILKTFIELAPVGVALFQKSKIQIVNTTMTKITGFSDLQMKNWELRDIIDIFDSEYKEKVKQILVKNQKEEDNNSVDILVAKFFDATGQQKWGEFYVKTSYFQGFISYFVILIDITEKYNLEEKFKLAFLNSPYPIVVVDGGTNQFLVFNDKFIEMFGYEPNELIKMEFDDLSFPEDIAKQKLTYKDKIAHEDGFKIQLKKNYRRKNGSVVETIVASEFLKLSEDKGFFITQLVDISYLNELEYYKDIINSLENANNELQSLNQIVSHDVKAPLNVINGLLELIESNHQEDIPEDAYRIFKQIKEKTSITSQLVKDILEYSNIGFSEEQSTEVISTNDLVDEITNLLHMEEKFQIQKQTALPALKIPKVRIHQIFQNLLSNAMKYNDKKEGIIQIGAYDLGKGYWEFFMEDNGIGIEQKDISSVFQLFKTLKNSPDSTGVGLAIVKKIVEFYGGEVKIVSEVEVKTRVSFTIPSKYIVT